MDYREYGRTGKEVSAIGFGGLRFPKEDYQSGNYENLSLIHIFQLFADERWF